MKTQLIMMGICLVIGAFVWEGMRDWFISEPEPIEPNTLIEYRYIDKHDTLIVPIFKTVVQKDTISYIDTVFIHTNINYIAEIDTTYEDSTLTAHVQYVSPIQLSPKSYFNLDFKVREKIITNTVVQTREVGFFYKRFIPYIGVGLSYGIDSKIIEPAIQIGFGVRIN